VARHAAAAAWPVRAAAHSGPPGDVCWACSVGLLIGLAHWACSLGLFIGPACWDLGHACAVTLCEANGRVCFSGVRGGRAGPFVLWL